MNYYNPMDQPLYIMQKHKPAMAYKDGEDIDTWRNKAREKLVELIGLDKFERVASNYVEEDVIKKDGYTRIRYSMLSEAKSTVVGYLLFPNDVPNPPLMICIQGHSNGMHISLGEANIPEEEASIAGGRDFAIQAVKHGLAALVIEQRNFGERKRNPSQLGTDCHVPSMLELMLGRTTIAARVWDISRVLDEVLLRYPRIDKDNIGIMGNSGGGTVTYYTACLEDRITACMPSCALCTYKESIGTIMHCVCNHIPGILNYFEMADLALLIAPKPMVLVNGRYDDIFPLNGVKRAYDDILALYKLVDAEDNLKWVIGEGGHQFYPEIAWPVYMEVTNGK